MPFLLRVRRHPHIHDFGSILNFVEYIFGSGGNSLPEIDAQNSYHYADFWAPDYWGNLQYCSRQVCPYALSVFFNFTQPPTPPIWITPINCPASCFLNFTGPPFAAGFGGRRLRRSLRATAVSKTRAGPENCMLQYEIWQGCGSVPPPAADEGGNP